MDSEGPRITIFVVERQRASLRMLPPKRSSIFCSMSGSRAGLTQLDIAWLTVLLCYCAIFGGILIYDAAPHLSYTHATASPGLFAYLLDMLGTTEVELLVAVTVFTIGLLAFWFAYRFLAEISTRLYATIACLLLMTDYIMFVQWHIGVWHVWKMFLLFGGLYLAQRIAANPSGKQLRPLLAVYAFHAFLFYYETIFNVYVAAAVLRHRRSCHIRSGL
jgi:hypothetical protein